MPALELSGGSKPSAPGRGLLNPVSLPSRQQIAKQAAKAPAPYRQAVVHTFKAQKPAVQADVLSNAIKHAASGHVVASVILDHVAHGLAADRSELASKVSELKGEGIRLTGGSPTSARVYLKANGTPITDVRPSRANPIDLSRSRAATPAEASRMEQMSRAKRASALGHVVAPGLAVLNQIARPGRAVAGAANALVQGKGLGGAATGFERGLIENKPTTFGDVLKSAGVPSGPLRSIAGFGLDVATDPTTYATLGAAPVARKIAADEAARVEAKALKAGMAPETASRLGALAGKRAAASAPQNKGLQLGARGGIPFTDKRFAAQTSGRTTAAVARKTGITRAGTAVRETKPVQALGSAFVHDFRPKEIPAAQHGAAREALRQHRADLSVAQNEITKMKQALAKALPHPSDQRAVIDMLESGKALPKTELGNVARNLRATFEHQRRVLTRAGVGIEPLRIDREVPFPAEAKGYFPHVPEKAIKPEPGSRVFGAPAGALRVSRMRGRAIREPLSVQRQAVGAPHVGRPTAGLRGITTPEAPRFSEDVPAITAHEAMDTAKRAGMAKIVQRVASLGRDLKPGQGMHIGEHEAVYKSTPHGLTPVDMKGYQYGTVWRPEGLPASERAGRFVVLNKHLVEHVESRLKNTSVNDPALFQWLDKMQGNWKKVVTILNPSYHGRNLTGDTLNAIGGGATARSFRQSADLLKALHARNVAASSKERFTTLGKSDVSQLQKTLKIDGKEVTYGDVLHEAEKQGAIRTGFFGTELRQLTGEKVKPQRWTAFNQYREDFPRLASYLSARKAGLPPSAAAEHSLKHLYDYADLTPAERQIGRRLIPFYTFFARNTRVQVTKMLAEPGKITYLSHALDEAAQGAGFQNYSDYVGNLPEANQRGFPVPIKFNGHVLNAYVSPPATDLNQLSASPGDLTKNIGQRLTFFKLLPELAFNYSMFFGKQIEDPKAPRVKAPSFVADLPGPVKDFLGVAKILDKKSGKMVWGWNARADYVARQLPQTNQIIQLMTPGAGSRGLTPATAAIGLTGVKITGFNNVTNDINMTYQALSGVQDALGALHQRGKDKSAPEYQKLLQQQALLHQQLQQLQQKRGDKIIGSRKAQSGGWNFSGSAPASSGSGWNFSGGGSAPAAGSGWKFQ